jgi:hypothetical protein
MVLLDNAVVLLLYMSVRQVEFHNEITERALRIIAPSREMSVNLRRSLNLLNLQTSFHCLFGIVITYNKVICGCTLTGK